MKIVHFSSRLGRFAGGLYHSVSGMTSAMAALGADVTVIGGREAHFEEERSVWGSVPLITFPLGPSRYGFAPAVVAEIARLKPDLLHIQGLWSAGSIYARLAPKTTRVVISPRGMLDPWILRRRPWLKAPHAALGERPSFKRAAVHALTQHEAEAAAAFMPEIRDRTFVVPNGIANIGQLSTPRHGALYLGRLHAKKQVLRLIETWGQQKGKLELTVAGWGTPEEERQVALACSQANRTSFVGAIYGEAKEKVLAAARFFILPSLSEGLPMAALEAAAYGAIPVMTDACHLPDLLEDGLGIKIKDDFSDFAAARRQLEAMDEAEMARRSVAVRTMAQRNAWPNVARSMLDHYVRILSGPEP